MYSPNRDARPQGKRPDLVVMHATASGGWHSAYTTLMGRTSRRVSAHYLVDRDGHYEALVPEEQEAWHAGLSSWVGFPSLYDSLNWRSIGYELVNLNNGKDPWPVAQLDTAAHLVAATCKRW